MASGWTGITDLVDTGNSVATKLDNAFTALDTDIANIVLRETIYASLAAPVPATYNLTATPQVVKGYSTAYVGNYMTIDAVNGTITPTMSGEYRISFLGSMTFTSTVTTRTVTLELYNVTDSVSLGEVYMNMPRDSTKDSIDPVASFPLVAGKAYAVRVSSAPDMSITFGLCNFAIDIVGF